MDWIHLFPISSTLLLLLYALQWQPVFSTIHHLHPQLKYSTEIELLEVQSTNPNDIHFYLYSPNERDVVYAEELHLNDASSIQNSNYDRTLPIIILVHGFTQNYLTQFPVVVRDAYLAAASSESQANIICVDWGKLSTPATTVTIPILEDVIDLLSYKQAVQNVPVVARRVQLFLLFLLANGFLPDGGAKSVHLVGHSLGAQIAGLAGQFYYDITSMKIGRITATDPAGPLFQNRPVDERLDPTDATFVDIIHTNQHVLGYNGPTGLVDFFVNGGGPESQPGCSPLVPDCSHNMAWRFYAKSIENDQIQACPCTLVYNYDKDKNSTTRPPTPTLIIKSCEENEMVTFGEFVQKTASGFYCLQLHLHQ